MKLTVVDYAETGEGIAFDGRIEGDALTRLCIIDDCEFQGPPGKVCAGEARE